MIREAPSVDDLIRFIAAVNSSMLAFPCVAAAADQGHWFVVGQPVPLVKGQQTHAQLVVPAAVRVVALLAA